MIFELDNVELYFKSKRILNGIYLKAETGKVTGLLGSNGCGKSCLLDIAFGNLNPKYKLVRIDSKPVTKALYKTGLVKYLPQYHFIPNRMKLRQVFKLYEVNWDVFSDEYQAFYSYKNQRFNTLSGGERRFIEAYLILKCQSQLVLLDEPFSHLSPLYVETLKEIIVKEKAHKTIIVTDHMYRHIIDLSDTIYLLKNGTTKRIKNIKELEDYNYLSEGSIDN